MEFHFEIRGETVNSSFSQWRWFLDYLPVFIGVTEAYFLSAFF